MFKTLLFCLSDLIGLLFWPRVCLGLLVFLKKNIRFFSAISGQIVSYCADKALPKLEKVFLHIRGSSEELLIFFLLLCFFLPLKDNAFK